MDNARMQLAGIAADNLVAVIRRGSPAAADEVARALLGGPGGKAAGVPIAKLRELALKALDDIRAHVGPVIDKIKAKLQLAKWVRLGAQILTILATGTLLGTVITNASTKAVVVAIVAFAASLLPAIADALATTAVGGDKLLVVFQALLECEIGAQPLYRDIDALDPTDPANEGQLRQLCAQADALAMKYLENVAQL